MALLIEYDGSAYHGFQVQQNSRTVQGTLETALHRITGEHNRLKGASRTDAGVHALGQVATFTTQSLHSPKTFIAALNYYLPQDVVICDACEVEQAFDARRDVVARNYRYVVFNRRTPSPLTRAFALWLKEDLDVETMNQAVQPLVGEHDVASFSGPLTRPQRSTVRRIFRAEIKREEPFIYLSIAANAFLPQQVRRTMGILLEIGRRRIGPEVVETLLERPVLGAASLVAASHGLWLINITYPEGMVSFQEKDTAVSAPTLYAAVTSERGGW